MERRQMLRYTQNKEELVESLSRRCAIEGQTEVADGLNFYKHSSLSEPVHGLYSPSLCLIAQGAKEVRLGDDRYRYDSTNFLLCSLDLPVIFQVVEASSSEPYLGLKLDLDPRLIANVTVESGLAPSRPETSMRSVGVSKLSGELLDAIVRLLRASEDSTEYRAIAPLIIREIIYRLLRSEQGPRLRQMAMFGGNANRVSQAVDILKTRLDQSIKMEDLANELGMSISSFHQHFKSVTSMSPLQFQKLLRLQEARRLLLTEDVDAYAAAVRVGYDDASQFSREYKRMFGEPPKRDALRFKQLASTSH